MHDKLKLIVSNLTLVIVSFCTSCYAQQNLANQSPRLEFRITFENNIVGHIYLEKQSLANSQRTIETLELNTQFRGMKPLTTRIVEIQEEDNQGNPLSFSKHIEIPNAEHHIYGEIKDSIVNIRYLRGQKETRLQQKIPDNFLLSEGLRQQMKKVAKENQTLVYSEWDYDSQKFTVKKLSVFEEKNPPYQWRTVQQSLTQNKTTPQEQWLDQDFLPLKSSFNYLGKKLELTRCPDKCDDDKLSALRPLDHQIIGSPYQITDIALKGHIRYEIQMSDLHTPVATNEQKVRKTESSWVFDVCAHCADYQPTTLEKPDDYLAANSWMEVNDKKLIAAVAKNTKVNDTAKKKMEKLGLFTRKRLEINPQFAGYASALQAYESRTGDCTEYALLLATLGRIAQIPTRVVFGLSYSREYFHGKKNSFIPHAWVQAWIDGAWRSYDGALGEFDAGHIALNISDGNPQDFRAMFEDFNQLKIIFAQQIVPKKQSAQ